MGDSRDSGSGLAMSRSTWRWFGHPGHLCVSSHCRFHLCTKVGHYLVSTVGEYVPDSAVREILAKSRGIALAGQGDEREADWMRKVGFEDLGFNRKYETMVFRAGKPCALKSCGCGLPAIDGQEIDCAGYNDPASAASGHVRLCEKWDVE